MCVLSFYMNLKLKKIENLLKKEIKKLKKKIKLKFSKNTSFDVLRHILASLESFDASLDVLRRL